MIDIFKLENDARLCKAAGRATVPVHIVTLQALLKIAKKDPALQATYVAELMKKKVIA